MVTQAGKKDRLSQWINRIVSERGWNKAVVAIANTTFTPADRARQAPPLIKQKGPILNPRSLD
ncbi:MAG: hypothetical protein WA140_12530 [Geobacteraceae bacterium]